MCRVRSRLWRSSALALCVSAGCGADDAQGTAPDGPPPRGDITIVEVDYQFVPAQLPVPVGTDLTVVIENRDDKTSHNIHFPTLPGRPRTKLENGPGYQTLEVRFDQPGRYPFVCDIHATMRGTAVTN
jgi:plastocyanin